MTVNSRVSVTWGGNHQHLDPPYLLVESSDRALAASDFHELAQAGFDVAFCSGPWPGEPCPLQRGLPCPLVESADVVLHLLDPALGVASAVRARRPDLPVVTAGPAGSGADLPAGAPLSLQIRAVRAKLAAARAATDA